MKKLLSILMLIVIIAGCSSTEKLSEADRIRMKNTEIILKSERELNKSLREVPIDKKVYNNKLAYVAGENTPFTGVFTTRYIGHLMYFEEYKEGLLHGTQVWFGDSGNIGMRKYFLNGKQEGDELTYYPNGNLRSIIPYKNGEIEGTIEWYNEKGLEFDSSEIVNGSGRYISYWNNGNIKIVGALTNNRKTGVWKEYNQSGELEKEITYSKKGRIINQKWYK